MSIKIDGVDGDLPFGQFGNDSPLADANGDGIADLSFVVAGPALLVPDFFL